MTPVFFMHASYGILPCSVISMYLILFFAFQRSSASFLFLFTGAFFSRFKGRGHPTCSRGRRPATTPVNSLLALHMHHDACTDPLLRNVHDLIQHQRLLEHTPPFICPLKLVSILSHQNDYPDVFSPLNTHRLSNKNSFFCFMLFYYCTC